MDINYTNSFSFFLLEFVSCLLCSRSLRVGFLIQVASAALIIASIKRSNVWSKGKNSLREIKLRSCFPPQTYLRGTWGTDRPTDRPISGWNKSKPNIIGVTEKKSSIEKEEDFRLAPITLSPYVSARIRQTAKLWLVLPAAAAARFRIPFLTWLWFNSFVMRDLALTDKGSFHSPRRSSYLSIWLKNFDWKLAGDDCELILYHSIHLPPPIYR